MLAASAVCLPLLQTEHRKRDRARKAAVKPAVEYDEDGHVKVSKAFSRQQSPGSVLRVACRRHRQLPGRLGVSSLAC